MNCDHGIGPLKSRHLLRQAIGMWLLRCTGFQITRTFVKIFDHAIDRGLKEEDALAGLTTVPAKLTGSSSFLGTIEKGRIANLTIVEGGSWFDPDNPVSSVWIEGRHYPVDKPKSGKGKKGGI